MASSAVLLALKHLRDSNHRRFPETNQSSCSLFTGTWVRDYSYPIYQPSDCGNIIDSEFNCQANGRPDSDYLRYRWQPLNCQLLRFNGLDFLRKMSGKTVMFVGDSLGKNQWESLICMISAGAPESPTQIIQGDPLSAVRYSEYGVTVSFYRTSYLVDIGIVKEKRVLKLDEIWRNGEAWKDVDVLSFNTGHWWTHNGSLQGWDYMEAGGSLYQDMDRLDAFERGLRTWANWVNTNLDSAKTTVFFVAISPTHYNPNEWSGGTAPTSKNCYGEAVPMSGTTYPGAYPEQMSVVEDVMSEMTNKPYLLDITMLSQLRKDAHPSIYGTNTSSSQRPNSDLADCSHWCLPGLPDTWNQLFYTALFS